MKNFVQVLIFIFVLSNLSCEKENKNNFTIGDNIYNLTINGKNIVSQLSANNSSFFYVTAKGPQYLLEKTSENWQDSAYTATFSTTDDRIVELTITQQENKYVEVDYNIEPEEGVLETGDRLQLQAGEMIHGLTERVTGNSDGAARDPQQPVALARNGERVAMNVSATISLYAPYFQSTQGYGLYVDNTYLGYFDVEAAEDNVLEFAFQKADLHYYLVLGDDPIQIQQNYMQLIGLPLMPPKWALGIMRWRDTHYTPDTLFTGVEYKGPFNVQLYEDIRMMELLDIPTTYYMIDRPWSEGSYGYGAFEWERDRFPNPEAMVEWLNEKGKELIVWIAPWVNDEAAVEAMQKGYFIPGKGMIRLGITSAEKLNDPEVLKQAQQKVREALEADHPYGTEMASHFLFNEGYSWRDEEKLEQMRDRIVNYLQDVPVDTFKNKLIAVDRGVLLVDFTNPQAVDWWQAKLQKVIDDGVQGFKLDRGDEIVPTEADVVAHNGQNMAELHNYYPVLYAKATYEVLERNYDQDLVVMPRAGYPGTQKFATPWGGDHENTWLGLRNAVIGGIRSAIIGFPFWGSDTGGYQKPTDREILMRWLGFSAFNPIMEVGPTSNGAPWNMPLQPHYDTAAIATFRLYAKLKEQMLDYTYQQAEKAHQQGESIIKPLFYYHPDDSATYNIHDSFYYGDQFLVSPVINPGQSSKEVYLPAGEWSDYWQPENTYQGPQVIEVETPVYKIPIFIKGGSQLEIMDLQAIYDESYRIASERKLMEDGSEIRINQ